MTKKKMTLSKLKKKTQDICNKFIRERDMNDDGNWECISCGCHIEERPNAGHYIPVNVSSRLRYNENNIHVQCIRCNRFMEGFSVGYRHNLIKKIGNEETEKIECTALFNRDKKWTVDELLDLITYYKNKLEQIGFNKLNKTA